MTLLMMVLLFGAGVAAGIINAIAGGGILFVLPVMLASGIGPVSAAASAAVAVVPAHAVAILGDRPAALSDVRNRLPRSAAIAATGGIVGAFLLLGTGDRLFRGLVPWLILFATLAFALGPQLARLLQGSSSRERPLLAVAFEFLVALYGGYFGAGLGVLMMAALGLLGIGDVRQANWLKNVLATVISAVAVAIYIAGGAVAWHATLLALAGALAGGYIGARIAGNVPAKWLKRGVMAIGAALSAYYFLH